MFSKLFKTYWRSLTILIVLFGLGALLPPRPLDPWGILNVRKVLQLVFALSLIQVLGDLLLRIFGSRIGAIATGFFGGLVSSTALTAAIAKESQNLSELETQTSSLAFLTATLAMLAEAIVLVLYGAPDFHPKLLILFAAPVLMTLSILLISSRRSNAIAQYHGDEGHIDFRSVIKLTTLIAIVLLLSRLLERQFGQNALIPLTLIMSLFEVHSSIIANVQLHDEGVVGVPLLGNLLAISFMASYASKLFLVQSLGNSYFKRRVWRWTLLLAGVTGLAWLVFWIS